MVFPQPVRSITVGEMSELTPEQVAGEEPGDKIVI
jgi:hypothetical protein